MFRYHELLTDISSSEIEKWQAEIQKGNLNPKDLKARLAGVIVADFWGEEKARQAAEEFDRIFKKKELPDEMLIIELKAPDVPLLDLLVDNGILPSRGEAKRLVRQGGISIDGQKIEDIGLTIALAQEDTAVLKIGKRKFYKLIRN